MYRISMYTWMLNECLMFMVKCRWNIPNGWWILKAYGCRCWFPLIWACQYCWWRSHPMKHLLGSGFKHALISTLPVGIGMKLAYVSNLWFHHQLAWHDLNVVFFCIVHEFGGSQIFPSTRMITGCFKMMVDHAIGSIYLVYQLESSHLVLALLF